MLSGAWLGTEWRFRGQFEAILKMSDEASTFRVFGNGVASDSDKATLLSYFQFIQHRSVNLFDPPTAVAHSSTALSLLLFALPLNHAGWQRIREQAQQP